MADEVKDPKIDQPEAARGADSSAVPDPRDARIAELEDYATRAQATFERLKPLEEDIQALEDEGYRAFQRTSRKSYYQMLEEQQKAADEELSPGEKRLLAKLDEKLKPAIEEVEVLRKDRESRTAAELKTAKDATEKFTRENLEYAQRLVAEQKLTPDEVQDLGRYAKVLHDETVARGEARFVPLEEAYKRLYGRAEERAAKPVPKSLRAKAGATGVPGASRPAEGGKIDMNKPGNFTSDMLRRMNARKTG
jgi:hypothetical protein